MSIRPLHNPSKGKLRVIGFISGSGKTLWQALELQKKLDAQWEGSPFEIVGVFSSDPAAKGVATAEELGIPVVSSDIRGFYKSRDARLNDLDIRREYDKNSAGLIEGFRADLVLLAGYVWATTEVLLHNYLFINVHPADLSLRKDGQRLYAGANGVGDALAAREPFLRSSSHIATPELDGGPLLIISPPIPVDYEKAAEFDAKDFMRFYLRQVNAQSRAVGARTVYEVALGNFGRDEHGGVYYRGRAVPDGITVESWDRDRPLFERSTEALLRPKSIAVVGASARGGIGYSIVKNVEAVNFTGEVYAVNRGGEQVLSSPGYPSITDIPGSVDLAVLAVPSNYVLQVAEECGRKGVGAIVCISAGFREVGGDGVEAEQELLRIVNTYNMRLLGPNCMGVSNNAPDIRLNATILHDIPGDGNIAFVTQSGGLGAVLLDYASRLGIGFSSIVSLGNQADLNVNDILPLLAEDEHTEVIMLYLEEIADFRRFSRLAAGITPKKPIVLLKAGRTGAGAAAAGSHTGSLAGDDKVVDALIRKCGILRADSIYQMYYIAAALSRMPRIDGNRVAVISNGGGPAILVTDALVGYGFDIPVFSEEVQTRLAEELLPEASVRNPIDVVATAPPAHYAASLRQILGTGEKIDAVVLLCIPPATINTGEVAAAFVEEINRHKTELEGVPVLSCFFGPNLGKEGRETMTAAGIPALEYPEQIAEILNALRRLPGSWDGNSTPVHTTDGEGLRKISAILDAAPEGNFLPAPQCEDLLRAAGLSLTPSVYFEAGQGPNEADIMFQDKKIRFPVVAKIDHPELLHKSDRGGVVLNIPDQTRLNEVMAEMQKTFPGGTGILVQQQLDPSLEVILGAVKDPSAGHAVMVGLGGTLVELLEDVAFAHVPFDEEEARRTILSLKSSPLLTGYRGSSPINIDDLIGQMLRLSRLLVDFPSIEEVDLNPLLYSPGEACFYIADFRIRKGK